MNYLMSIKNTLYNISLDGRADNREYIAYKVFEYVFEFINFFFYTLPIVFVLFAIIASAGETYLWNNPNTPAQHLFNYTLAASIVFIPLNIWIRLAGYCVSVRRLHDINQSGWIYFGLCVIACTFGIMFNFLIFFAAFIVLAIIKSYEGENQYGIKTLNTEDFKTLE
ncbi:MAG: DUF805 domain-containing protein [Candidatus Gastranaerophilales bacterium]|nr:DUF805 domain-containing protein [Candidatus Gastranaerophilales bacterium]